ncbi:hypothetical protein ACN28S_61330 [Cystobacter fuscus]
MSRCPDVGDGPSAPSQPFRAMDTTATSATANSSSREASVVKVKWMRTGSMMGEPREARGPTA